MGLALLAGEAGNVAQTMGTAFQGIQSDAMSAISTVAPYAIGIMGAFLVWKIGSRFFKSVSK